MKDSLKMRILLNVLLIAIVLLGLSILAYFTQGQIAQKAGDIETSATSLDEISHMQLLVSKIIMPANDYLITGDAAEKNNYTQLVSQLDEQIERVKGIKLGDDGKKHLRKIETQLKQTKSKSDAIFGIEDPINDKSGGIIMEEMDVCADAAVDEAEMLHIIFEQEVENTREAYLRILSRNRILLVIFSVIGLSLALYASINANKMADNIQKLITADREAKEHLEKTVAQYALFVGEIAEGDLTANLQMEQGENGALGQLSNDLNSMVESLRKITEQVKETSTAVTSATSEIASTVSQQNASASEQSAAVSETVTTIDEIKQTAQTVTERANAVAEVARQAANASEQGQRTVADVISGVNNIKEQVGEIGNSILTLNEKTQVISSIIEAVNNIAEQSKMLAFNAAIEASKAGEAGKGFSVVASEIRNLAERSQEETKNVHDILDDIQKAANSAVMIAEKGSNEADEGVNLASRAGKNIDQLAETVAQATDAMEQITMSIEQQNLAIEQISQAMQNINQATDETASGTKQTEKATQALNQLAMQMTELVEQYTL